MFKKAALFIIILVLVPFSAAWAKSYLILVNEELYLNLYEGYDGRGLYLPVAERLQRDFRAKVQVESIDVDQRPNPVNRYLTDGYDLIIGLGIKVSEAVYTSVINHDGQRYALIDNRRGNLPDNTLAFSFSGAEGAFLAGFIAAKMSGGDQLGFIGGARDIQVMDLARGFADGAAYAEPGIYVNRTYLDDYFDLRLAQRRATELYHKNVTVIYEVAGYSGQGVREAARYAGKWVIATGLDSTDAMPPNVLTTVVLDYNQAVYEACRLVEENRFVGGQNIRMNLANGGVVLGNIGNVPAEIAREVQRLAADIKNGKVTVRDSNNKIVNN